MKKRIELLAGLVDEDDFESTRQEVVESYQKQVDDDVHVFCEHVDVVEEDEYRLNKMLSMEEQKETDVLNEQVVGPGDSYGVAHGHGLGPGFCGFDNSKKEVFDPFRKASSHSYGTPNYDQFTDKWSKNQESVQENVNQNIEGYEFLGNNGQYNIYAPISQENVRIGVTNKDGNFVAVAMQLKEQELTGFAKAKSDNLTGVLKGVLEQLSENVENLLPMSAIDAMSELKEGNDILVYNDNILRETLMKMEMIAIDENGLKLTSKGEKHIQQISEGVKTLSESHEGRTPGNAWFYDRTGNTDGGYLRFREDPYGDNPPKMHPPQPEQPTSKGWPGLEGWKFYENSPEYIKIQAKSEDPLDMGITKASEEAYKKFWDRYSVYGEPESQSSKKKVNESYDSYEDAIHAEFSKEQALKVLRSYDLFEEEIKEFFMDLGDKPVYTGKEILDWLGY